MGKWETKKREKKDALFRTAFRLFTEKGFAKTTISDIVTEAGLAKGTFYLYFKDKYELRDKLIASKAAQLLSEAYATLDPQAVLHPETLILGMFDYIIERFEEEPALLQFIAKNLSWGIFKTAFQEKLPEESRQFYEYYLEVLEKNSIVCAEPELLLFTVIELVDSTCYHCILYQDPVSMQEYRPYLRRAILGIFSMFTADACPEPDSPLS